MFDRRVQTMFYERASVPEELPWHRDDPPDFLADAVAARSRPGRALDLGCGSGVFSVYLAKHGYDVTGIDLMPRAIDMARERSAREGVDVRWRCADLLRLDLEDTFDIVLDSGCLHSLIGGDPRRYKQQLLRWTRKGSDYVLGHFGKRGPLDWRPVGPARRTRRQLEALFAPELAMIEHEQSLITGVALPIGPTVQGLGCWFQRT